MIVFDKEMLEEYLKNDWILNMLLEQEDKRDESVRTHKWLKEMDNKRLIYSYVYGDILKGKEQSKRVLDVGGGYTSIAKKLLESCDYHLLDFMSHGGNDVINELQRDKAFWINEDWMKYDIKSKSYDIIIANDIFPDVDQRLELFIEKYLPYCKEMRLVLTFYNIPKWYLTQRTDDTERLTFLSWDGEITKLKLEKYKNSLIETSDGELSILPHMKESIFYNKRQVIYVRLKGEEK